MKLAWFTDLHLNFVRDTASFLASLPEADAYAITGDTAEAHDAASYLLAIAEHRPVYFVLGNHDYYRGSIASVRDKVRKLGQPNLCWMQAAGVLPLTAATCLIGADGWGDGRFGDYHGSAVQLNDWWHIDELAGHGKQGRLSVLQSLADESAAHLRSLLPEATCFERVIVLTHVPPFRESCWHEGEISDDDWLPHFACKAVGDVLIEAMLAAPECHLTVLCGHTHGAGETRPLPNLHVLTGGAVYGQPVVQRIFDID